MADESDTSGKMCKMTILQQIVYSGDFDVAVTVRWLKNSVIDSEIIPGYSIFRRDRENRAGGVLIAVKGGIQASRRPDLEKDGIELVVIHLEKGNTKPVTLYCFYQPDPLLLALNLLPLTFNRKLKDMVFFYKCLNNLTNLNV